MVFLKDTQKEQEMARKIPKKTDFSKNVKLYYAAVAVVILGYVFLAIGDANSLTSLTLGPIVLVLGYLVASPVALLAGIRDKESLPGDTADKDKDNS